MPGVLGDGKKTFLSSVGISSATNSKMWYIPMRQYNKWVFIICYNNPYSIRFAYVIKLINWMKMFTFVSEENMFDAKKTQCLNIIKVTEFDRHKSLMFKIISTHSQTMQHFGWMRFRFAYPLKTKNQNFMARNFNWEIKIISRSTIWKIGW